MPGGKFPKGLKSYAQVRREVRKELNKQQRKNVEVKSEILTGNPSMTNTGVLVPILQSTISGTAHDQRVGNRTELLSMNLRIMTALADTGYNNVRYAIIKCREEPASVSAVFETTSYGTFGSVFASWDYDIVEKVYLDKNVTLNQQVSGARASKFNKHWIKSPMGLHYNTAAANSLQEKLYLVLCSDSAIAPNPGCNYVLRSRYTDE